MTTNDLAELSNADFESAISSRLRKRLIQGKFESGEDVAALRRFVRARISSPRHDPEQFTSPASGFLLRPWVEPVAPLRLRGIASPNRPSSCSSWLARPA